MSVEVKMPQMGESITEGTIVKWHKKPGDKVRRDEVLFEISTDKVDTEVPSPAEGYLAETYVGEGQTVPVHTPVCRLTQESSGVGDGSAPGGSAPEPTAAAKPPSGDVAPRVAHSAGPAASGVAASAAGAEKPAAVRRPREQEGRGRLSPAVRRLLREHDDLDLDAIRGTGADGRITRKDILRHLERAGRGAPAAGTVPPAAEDRLEPLTIMRRQIADHMVRSKRISPHVYTIHEADMSEVARLRKSILADGAARDVRPSYLAFIVQAVAAGLRRFPVLNASFTDEGVRYRADVNVGVAVALDDGLIVPVLRRADRSSVLEIARSIEDLASRARAKKLKPEEVQGGTFTITNPGVFGSIVGLPIIHQPQSAILCVGAVKKRVVVVSDEDDIGIRSMCYLTLSFDHRLIDGATADRFLGTVAQVLEEGEFRIG